MPIRTYVCDRGHETEIIGTPSVVDDEVLPANTFYQVQIVMPGLGAVYNQSVPITGASFNLASFVPNSVSTVSGGSTVSPMLETNGTQNTIQSTLNLKSGSNVTLSADGAGGVTIAATGGVTLETNGVPNTSQTVLNLAAGNSGVTLSSDSSGDVTFTVLEQKALVTITSTQLKNLETTPVTLVPAQGPGSFILPVSSITFVYKPVSTPYTLSALANQIPSLQVVYDYTGFLPTQGLTGMLSVHAAQTGSILGLNTLNRTYTQALQTAVGTGLISPFTENVGLLLTNVATAVGGNIVAFTLLGNSAGATFTIAEAGNSYAVNDVFSVTSVGGNGAIIRFTVTSINAAGGVTGISLNNYRSDAQWYTRNYVKATAVAPSAGQGLYINVTAPAASGANGITGYTISNGGTGYNNGDTGTITPNTGGGGGGTSGKYTVTASSGGVVSAISITSVGGGFYSGGTANTTKTTGSGSGMVLNVTSTGGGYAVNDTGATGNGSYTVTSVDASGNVTGMNITSQPTNIARGVNTPTTSTGIGLGLNYLFYQAQCDATAGDGTLVVMFDYIVLTP